MTRILFPLVFALSTLPLADVAQAQTGPQIIDEAETALVDETAFEARQNEAQLTQAERAEIQRMLQQGGYYLGAIDAAFGPGTRAAMRAWQTANGYEPSGIMTTRQRAELFREFNKVLEELDVRLVRDDASGIQIKVPLAAVEFDKYQSPFAFFEETGEVPGARMLLISQPGDRNKLIALYDILQTLEIVPE